MIKLTVGVITSPGDREYNEDSVGFCGDGENRCFVLADGLGGHGKGEVASGLAVNAAESWFLNGITDLGEWFLSAQDAVLQEQKAQHAETKMKTTMVCAGISGDKLSWGHIGDSRLYLFHNGRLIKRTLDHSVPQLLVSAGQLKESDIRFHEDRNRLLRVVGSPWGGDSYELAEMTIRRGKTAFLLCSDGFWELIDEENMTRMLNAARTVEEWLEKMEEEVRKNGENVDMDNYSALGVWIEKKGLFPLFH